MQNFEVLDARIASALNKIIHNSHFKRKISLEEQKAQKQDRFLRGRQIAYSLTYTGAFFSGGHDRTCVVLHDVRGNTNIKMERNMSQKH